jgi:hypothetical protein
MRYSKGTQKRQARKIRAALSISKQRQVRTIEPGREKARKKGIEK